MGITQQFYPKHIGGIFKPAEITLINLPILWKSRNKISETYGIKSRSKYCITSDIHVTCKKNSL